MAQIKKLASKQANVFIAFDFILLANDMWCTNRLTEGYPSELLPGPDLDKQNKPIPTPPPPKEPKTGGSSNAKIIAPTVALLFVTILLSLFM